jgi:hypothetical protein
MSDSTLRVGVVGIASAVAARRRPLAPGMLRGQGIEGRQSALAGAPVDGCGASALARRSTVLL